MATSLVLTCEHGGCEVPPRWADLLGHRRGLLESHRGRDQGALEMARDLAAALGAPLIASTTTRLLVDLNRSLTNPAAFSSVTRALPEEERRAIVEEHYRPHRDAVRAAVRAAGRGMVHVGVHSFTPKRKGVVRRADVALLYDPARPRERALCAAWKRALLARAPDLVVRRNYPFRGVDDGLTTALRRELPDARYAGIELEVNQTFVRAGGARWARMLALVRESLREALAG